jgi:hypothetical protein
MCNVHCACHTWSWTELCLRSYIVYGDGSHVHGLDSQVVHAIYQAVEETELHVLYIIDGDGILVHGLDSQLVHVILCCRQG